MWSIKNGIIEFDTINANNNKRFWKIFIKSNVVLRNIHQLEDNSLFAYYYTNYGLIGGKITQSSETEVKGKNTGRKNETTNLQQAIKECISMVNKKIKAGFSMDHSQDDNQNDKFYPMALNIYQNHKNKINYPVVIQPKLDGVRMTANINSKGSVEIVSRRLHEIFGFDSIKKELEIVILELVKEYGDKFKFIDGEIYKHGFHLQDISGVVRRDDSEDSKNILEYHIFDVCIEELGFLDRYKILSNIMNKYLFTKLVLTDTIICKSEQEGDELFLKYIEDKYEGIVYKTIDFKYEFSKEREKRSLKYLKRKKQMDAEYKIINYSEGKGKFKGLVIFTLQTEKGLEFQSVPTGTAEYRKKLYLDCLKDFSKYKDKLAKVKFDDLSKSGIPVRAVIIQVDRDITFD